MTNSPSDGGGRDGIRVELRMILSHDAEQRFDANGVEVLQLRGKAVDSQLVQPQVVVRFAGQQRAQLSRWARAGKHLSVVGRLEVKSYTASNGAVRIFLLIEATDIYPLNPDELNHAREGVYAAAGRASKQLKPRASKGERAERMRRMLEFADAG